MLARGVLPDCGLPDCGLCSKSWECCPELRRSHGPESTSAEAPSRIISFQALPPCSEHIVDLRYLVARCARHAATMDHLMRSFLWDRYGLPYVWHEVSSFSHQVSGRRRRTSSRQQELLWWSLARVLDRTIASRICAESDVLWSWDTSRSLEPASSPERSANGRCPEALERSDERGGASRERPPKHGAKCRPNCHTNLCQPGTTRNLDCFCLLHHKLQFSASKNKPLGELSLTLFVQSI